MRRFLRFTLVLLGAAANLPMPVSHAEGPCNARLPISAGDDWRYLKGVTEPPADWNAVAYDDFAWLIGPTVIGYGIQDNAATLLGDMQYNYHSVYMRRRFNLPQVSDLGGLQLTMSFDDAFVAYLNGVEVARSNISGDPPAFDVPAERLSHVSRPVSFDLTDFLHILGDDNVLAIQGHNARLNDRDFALMAELEITNPAPWDPTVVEPDGVTILDKSPLLQVDVSDPNADVLDVKFLGREVANPPPEDFTIIALPDTQFYSESYPEVFAAQTEWIVENKEKLNIVFVTHLGDCVENSNVRDEWVNADAAMSLLEDPTTTEVPDGIPYGIAVGNHDNGSRAGSIDDQGRTTALYNEFFGVTRFEERGYYGGHFGVNNDNHYQFFSAADMDFIVIHLEYDATGGSLREAVLEWADDVLESHRDRRAIITSHFLMTPGGAFSSQGRATHEQFKDNENVFLMLCGHLNEAGRRSDTNGHTIHTVLSDYQGGSFGGNGWLRIMTFSPKESEIRVQTYSPWLDAFKGSGEPHNFVLNYLMAGRFTAIGEVTGVASDSTAYMPWPGRESGKSYEWIAEVSDGLSSTSSQRAAFTRGVSEACTVAAGADDDCNGNTVHDRCDVDSGDSQDCDGDGTPDECQIAANGDADCNGNDVLDRCEWHDCNGNDVLDECDLQSNALADCNVNGFLDVCELDGNDCNLNGRRDDCDIAGGVSRDCDGNGYPDECDIASGLSRDCNLDAIPDRCQLDGNDCNDNCFADSCELAVTPSLDSNANGLLDKCEIAFTRGDCNGDGEVDISDCLFNLNFLVAGGKAPRCVEACNANDDFENDISDATFLLNFLFGLGAAPPAPFPACDRDPQRGTRLGCDRRACE